MFRWVIESDVSACRGRVELSSAADLEAPGSLPGVRSTYSVFGTWPGSTAAPPRGHRDASARPNGGEEETGGVHWRMDQNRRNQLAQRRSRGTPDG